MAEFDMENTYGNRTSLGEKVEYPLVSVVITCYNHAHYLPEAITSVLNQTYSHYEIIVVDDGSVDGTREVAVGFPMVTYVFQDNSGLSAARNTGIKNSSGEFFVFLDADDRLLPNALKTGLKCFKQNTDAALVFGTYQYINPNGTFNKNPPFFKLPDYSDHYFNLLHKNFISMHATVMYRSSVRELREGFNEKLNACEDYELYLRITRSSRAVFHNDRIAEYRKHLDNMSGNPILMLKSSLLVLKHEERFVQNNSKLNKALKRGKKFWKDFYGKKAIKKMRQSNSFGWRNSITLTISVLKLAPELVLQSAIRKDLFMTFKKLFKGTLKKIVKKPNGKPKVGKINFGDLRRLRPLSKSFGYDRGGPVDRYYIEKFLEENKAKIRGKVLEIKDDTYATLFGGEKVLQVDILDIDKSNTKATIIADLTKAENIPSDSYDCIILTQTLLLIYDVKAAISTAYRLLKPGGTLLVTVPGISQMDYKMLGNTWYWSFTEASSKKLFEEVFPKNQVEVVKYGNVFTAAALLFGISAKELKEEELNYHDSDYQVIISIKATK